MPIVTDAVYAAQNDNGIGFYQRDWLADEHWDLLGTISREQRKRYRKLHIIPCQVLCVWWDWDFLPHRQKPNQGTDMMRLLDHLYEWRYRNEAHAQRGLWLYERIVIEEIMPGHTPKHRLFLRRVGEKFMLRSELRKEPGSILR